MRSEFPGLPFLSLEGYRIRYGKSGVRTAFRLLLQVPRILKSVRQEQEWLKKMMEEYSFDAIIADNRYGLFHPSAYSVLVTHQLWVKSPFRNWGERLLNKRISTFINRFDECWIPDFKEHPSLAGELSHPEQAPAIPSKFLGPLSRLIKQGTPVQKDHLFISLSGPEPQRTQFENLIIQQIAHYPGTATVVRGLPASGSLIPSSNDIQFHNHLSSDDYAREMEKAEWVICRSGYSTVMDIFRLGKKAILIPTPGQSEQEYLATHLEKEGFACAGRQSDFRLSDLISKAKNYRYLFSHVPGKENLSDHISDFLSATMSFSP